MNGIDALGCLRADPARAGVGRLLPFSEDKQPYAFWVCSGHACGYTIGRNTLEQVFFKGVAASETVEKGAKRWVKYAF